MKGLYLYFSEGLVLRRWNSRQVNFQHKTFY